MSQFKAIPQPTDQRNVSQNDILTNFAYLNNANGAAASGILPVDHVSSGDNVANPFCGFHKQVSMINIAATPASLTNAVNSQVSSNIVYAIADGQGHSQVRMLNTWGDQPVTFIKAAVIFNSSGVIQGLPFNVSSVTVNVSNSFTVNFTTAMPSLDYLVFTDSESSSIPPNAGSPTTTPTTSGVSTPRKLVGSVEVYFQNSITGSYRKPNLSSVMVIGFF